jgi:hypothetical protein
MGHVEALVNEDVRRTECEEKEPTKAGRAGAV